MPIPKPREDENRDEFISRFMSDEAMKKEYPDEEQRAAIAFETWRGKNNSLENEHSARARKPEDFQKDSFRRQNIDDGVDIIIGRLHGEKTMTTQAYRFDEKKFSPSEAKKWLKDHDASYYSFDVGEAENLLNSGENPWAKKYRCYFIEPGLVHYGEYQKGNSRTGNVLIRKQTLDKILNTYMGKPVINEIHKEVNPEDFSNGKAEGIVSDVGFDPMKGFYFADYLVWDEETKENCENEKYSVSCAYEVTDMKEEKGIHNDIEYDMEVLDGFFTHLAIVDNPRYEDAKIIRNSKGGTKMSFAFFKRNQAKKEMKNQKEEEEKKKKEEEMKAQEEEKKKKEETIELDENSVINIGGREFVLKDLRDAYLEKENSIKNEEEAKKMKAQEEEEKKKKEEEMKAQEEEKKKKEEEMKNAKEKEGKKHFEDLRNSIKDSEEEIPVSFEGREEAYKRGRERY